MRLPMLLLMAMGTMSAFAQSGKQEKPPAEPKNPFESGSRFDWSGVSVHQEPFVMMSSHLAGCEAGNPYFTLQHGRCVFTVTFNMPSRVGCHWKNKKHEILVCSYLSAKSAATPEPAPTK